MSEKLQIIARGDGSAEAEAMTQVDERMRKLFFELGMEVLPGVGPSAIFFLMVACLGSIYGRSMRFAEIRPAPAGWTGSDEEIRELAATFERNAHLNYAHTQEKH
jgi:hypothetical protein